MQIYSEVLSKDLLELCKKDLLEKQKKPVWSSSSLTWDYDVIRNIDGCCISTSITDENIIASLNEELRPATQNLQYDEIRYIYNIWDSYSGLSLHDDSIYSFAATIYLNSNELCDGGLFIWQDCECPENFYRCLNPQENMMVINDNHEKHFVTHISPHSKQYRYTIQVWGKVYN